MCHCGDCNSYQEVWKEVLRKGKATSPICTEGQDWGSLGEASRALGHSQPPWLRGLSLHWRSFIPSNCFLLEVRLRKPLFKQRLFSCCSDSKLEESPSMNKLCTGNILGPAMQNEISETPSQVALTYLKELLLDFPVWWDFIQVIWQGLFSWLRRCSYCGLLACCTVSAEQSWFHGESRCHLDALGGSVNSLCWPGSTLVTLHNIWVLTDEFVEQGELTERYITSYMKIGIWSKGRDPN